MVQNLSGIIFFQGKVDFLKLGIWFQFYTLSNKYTFKFLMTSLQTKNSWKSEVQPVIYVWETKFEPF